MKWWKWLRWALLLLLILLVAAGLLVWCLPAAWAMPRLQARLGGLQLRGVHGLLWDGAADQVVDVQGKSIGRAQWRLSRWALLGRADAEIAFQGDALVLTGHLRQAGDQQLALDDVQARVVLDNLALKPLPWGLPLGQLQVHIDHALLQGQWPLQMQAKVNWQNARLKASAGGIDLGAVQLDLRGDNGVIQGQLHDDGQGALHIDGQLMLSPLGWRYAIELQPRHDTLALQVWLKQVAIEQGVGHWHIGGQGGLVAGAASKQGVE